MTVDTLQTGIWGAIGAGASLVLLYVVPTGFGLWQGKLHLNVSTQKVIGALLILTGTLSLGALTAVLIGSTDLKTAVAAGLGYQSTLAGAVRTAEG